MHPVQNFYYSKTLPPESVAMAHVRSTPVTPAGYVDKLNVLAGTGQIGPGGLGTHAWPVEANVFPPVQLGEPLAVNNDPEETGQSYEYIVENQFIEVTNKWDSETTYFYFHPLPSGVTQVSILDSKHEPVTVKYLIEGSRLYHTLEGDVYWVRYFANDRFQEELITSQLVMPRAPRLNKEEAPFAAPDHFALTHGVIDIPSWSEHRFRFTKITGTWHALLTATGSGRGGRRARPQGLAGSQDSVQS